MGNVAADGSSWCGGGVRNHEASKRIGRLSMELASLRTAIRIRGAGSVGSRVFTSRRR